MKILLIRTSSMGDLVHTLYAIEDLAHYRPDIELHWLCEESFADIAKLHPFVKKIITFSWRQYRKHLYAKKTWQTILKIKRDLQKEHYDLVIDSQGLLKSALIAKMAKAPIYGFDTASVREKLACTFYYKTVAIDEIDNVIWKNRQLFALIFNYRDKINRAVIGCQLSLAKTIKLDFLDKDQFHVCVHGASQDYKLWQIDKWRTLWQQQYAVDHTKILLTWGNEKEYQASLKLAHGLNFVSICPQLSLLQVAKLISLSQSVVSVDTGLLHLANAFNKPTVGIYNNTSLQNTKMENRNWEVVLGGEGKQDISVDMVYQNWNKVLENKKIA